MNIQKIGDFSFGGNARVVSKPVHMKEAVTDLKNQSISVKVDISKEGLEALRKEVQAMPGAINWEKEMRFREILPKLQMDPAGTHYTEMRNSWQTALAEIKDQKGNYNLEDIFTATMESYAGQYYKLVQSYEEGSRDIYVSDGVVNGEVEYHKVTLEEDLTYLNQAFERSAEGAAMYAGMQEQKWNFRHIFYGEPKLDIELPEDYQDRIIGLMNQTQDELVQKYESGAYASSEEMIADAKRIGSRVLKEDKEFWNDMKVLFKKLDWAQ